MSAAAWIEQHKSVQGLARLLAARGPQLLVLLLLLALSVDCALILTRILGGSAPLPAVSNAPAPRPARPPVNPTLELANIVNAHLFGSAAVSNSTDVPTTNAPLVLAGVIADQDPSKGQAIIGESAANAKLYAVGAALPGGPKLHAVYGDRVLIERNGTLEALKLPRTASGALRLASTSTPAPTPARDNSTLFAGLLRVQPVFTQGKLSGYRIFPNGARGNSAFNQMNLRPGDLITAVNGASLDDPSRSMEVLQTLSSSGSATVTVSRNGVAQEVNLNLGTLADDSTTDNGGGGGGGGADGNPPPTQPQPLRSRLGTAPAPPPPDGSAR